MNEKEILKLEKKLQQVQDFEPYYPAPEDYRFGGKTKLKGIILQPDGKWHGFLPIAEIQKNNIIDFFNCVSEAGTNIFEILYKRVYNISINFSARFAAKMNGTSRSGNTTKNFAQSAKNDGMVLEKVWSWTKFMNWAEFYKIIPDWIIQLGKKWTDKNKVQYEIVRSKSLSRNNFKTSLTESPLHWAVKAWYRLGVTGLYYSPSNVRHNHSVCGIGIYTKSEIIAIKDILEKYESKVPIDLEDGKEYPAVLDSYPPYIKFLTHDYELFPYAKKYKITKLTEEAPQEEPMKFYKRPNDPKLYQLGLGDLKYHHIMGEPEFTDLYKDFKIHEIIEKEIPEAYIGKPIGYRNSFLKPLLKLITNLFANLKGKK